MVPPALELVGGLVWGYGVGGRWWVHIHRGPHALPAHRKSRCPTAPPSPIVVGRVAGSTSQHGTHPLGAKEKCPASWQGGRQGVHHAPRHGTPHHIMVPHRMLPCCTAPHRMSAHPMAQHPAGCHPVPWHSTWHGATPQRPAGCNPMTQDSTGCHSTNSPWHLVPSQQHYIFQWAAPQHNTPQDASRSLPHGHSSAQVLPGSHLHLHRGGGGGGEPVQGTGTLWATNGGALPWPRALRAPAPSLCPGRRCLQGHEAPCQGHLHCHLG